MKTQSAIDFFSFLNRCQLFIFIVQSSDFEIHFSQTIPLQNQKKHVQKMNSKSLLGGSQAGV